MYDGCPLEFILGLALRAISGGGHDNWVYEGNALTLEASIAGIVDFARRQAAAVIVCVLALALLAGFYVSQHFAITTDVTSLIDNKVEWRQREIAFSKAFPQRDDLLVIVIDGKDGVGPDIAAERLTAALQERKDLIRNVRRPEASPYFNQNGFLLLPMDDLSLTLEQLIRAQPMLASLAKDNSFTGLFGMMELMTGGLDAGQVKAEELKPLFSRVDQSFQHALKNTLDADAWRYLLASEAPGKFELRRFILVQPVLDYSALSPGGAASDFIREIVRQQQLSENYNVTIRLTGPVPLSDEEFASISEGMGWALIASFAIICVILYLALRSWQLIVPIFIVLIAGLLITTAFALITVTSLNLISVAFAVMFTGIAVDFGIQFGVRYRDERFQAQDFAEALRRTGKIVAVPLLLAALSTAAGFFSFIPTSYRGVAELGWIAGSGMLFAFLLNITLLPALLRYFKPGPEREAIGYRWAAPVDEWVERNRKRVLQIFAVIFVAALVAGFNLRFDFDPLNLKDPKTESVSTMLELVSDTDTNPYTIDILMARSEEAEQLAERLRALPEVERVMTMLSLVPEEQDEKIALIQDTAGLLSTTLKIDTKPAPTASEEKAAATRLVAKMASHKDLGPDVERLVEALRQFAALPDDQVAALQANFRKTVEKALSGLKARLAPRKVDFTDIPGDIKSEWVSATGQVRVEVYPKGNARDPAVLTHFYEAVRKVAPQATGAPVSIQESANTIKQAFKEAALYAVISIFILLLVVLRRLRDTLYVLAPLVLSFILTLGTAALFGLAINFANIIALPLLLGLGVSYSIYFVVYWRQGRNKPLQSSMARAVVFSAATALVAFGSLSVSNHLGLLLTLSLFYLLFTTLFFLPSLLKDSVKSSTK
jgi:hopanoid biosynthesis associated RND transporter like protein HpnN